MTDVNIVFGDLNIVNTSELDDLVVRIFARVFHYPMDFQVAFVPILLKVATV